ncbi:MAG: hypothetical protein KGJ13_11560, partial [Patescibacteria group bacterium]|nr:hypothetical protein [Patescibacteria group bacterium]
AVGIALTGIILFTSNQNVTNSAGELSERNKKERALKTSYVLASTEKRILNVGRPPRCVHAAIAVFQMCLGI